MSEMVKKAIEGLAAVTWERPCLVLDALRQPVEERGDLTHVAPAEAEALGRTA